MGEIELNLPKELIVENEQSMQLLGRQLARYLQAGDLVLLNGSLGAGKTTMTRGIGRALGASGTIQSPTFVLARTHQTDKGPKLVHVDAYRLGSAIELDDLDIDFENSIVVMEWPRDFTHGLTDDWLEISITRDRESDARTVSIQGFGEWSRREVEIDFGN